MSISKRIFGLACFAVVTMPVFAVAQSEGYEDLAYVQRQANVNIVVQQARSVAAGDEKLSVQELAELHEGITTGYCASNPDGAIHGWLARVHADTPSRGMHRVEFIVAETASIVTLLDPASPAYGVVDAVGLGGWVRLGGTLRATGDDCLTQVPPLTQESLLRPAYVAQIETAADDVSDQDVVLLDALVDPEIWD